MYVAGLQRSIFCIYCRYAGPTLALYCLLGELPAEDPCFCTIGVRPFGVRGRQRLIVCGCAQRRPRVRCVAKRPASIMLVLRLAVLPARGISHFQLFCYEDLNGHAY